MDQVDIKRVYRVLIHGASFNLTVFGEPQKMGLYTTRRVEANSSEEAEQFAIKIVKHDLHLLGITTSGCDNAQTFHGEEIEEVSDLELSAGYAFYSEGD